MVRDKKYLPQAIKQDRRYSMTSITQKCKVDGCNGIGHLSRNGNRYLTNGYCNKHYLRVTKHGSTDGDSRQGHHMSHLPEYRVWVGIKTRCYNKERLGYEDYGGRGITVCDKWLQDFKSFYEYVGNKPSQRHSLDRINNNGNYEPGNVRWATAKEQNSNKRTSHLVEINGVTKTVTEWAKEYNLTKSLVYNRLNLGWSIIESLNTPIWGRRTKSCQ